VTNTTPTTRGAVDHAVATLFPGYFALVMATGIIAIGASQQDLDRVAQVLFVVAVAAYLVLGALVIGRIVRYPQALLADLTSHAKGFAFLTIVAATNVVGSAAAIIHEWWAVAWALWYASLALWALLAYTTLIAVVLGSDKPGLGAGINGTWFLLTVSTESVAVLGALLLVRDHSDLLAFICLAAFTLGVVLYLIVMTMVFLRWTFQPLEPTEADPPAWIAAGAVAITVLAGSNLLLARDNSPRLNRLAPFLEGIVVLAWATATFWFPLMVAIGVWRHIVRRIPLRYHPSYWAMVFPLGMYGAATYRMQTAITLDALSWLPPAVLAVALVAWTAAFVGMLQTVSSTLRQKSSSTAGRSPSSR
jgi:tellurite resistance protein TehA-like permease